MHGEWNNLTKKTMANLDALRRSQELQRLKTTGINAPTMQNPVIKKPSPIRASEVGVQGGNLRNVAGEEFTPVTVRGHDTGMVGRLDDQTKQQNLRTAPLSSTEYRGVVDAEQDRADRILGRDPATTGARATSRRFFGGIREAGISQDELMELTGVDDAQQARALIEGRGGLSTEDQLLLNQRFEQLKFDKEKAEAEGRLLTDEEQIRKDLESQFAPDYRSAREASSRARETALRVQGRAGMGSKSETEQQLLNEKQREIENSISAEKRIQERMLLAQARGASEEEIMSLSTELNNAKQARQDHQSELELQQAGLDAAALEVATEREKQVMKDALEAAQTGFIFNEETGQYEQDPNFTSPEDYDFQLQTDAEGNVTQVRTNKSTGQITTTNLGAIGKGTTTGKYQKHYNPLTGEASVFDPNTGQSYDIKTSDYNPITGGSGIKSDPNSKGYVVRDEGGSQCGEGVNDNTSGIFNGEEIHFGNSYESKSKWIDTNITVDNVEPGNTLVMPMTVDGSLENGHVAFVTGRIGNKIYVDQFNRDGGEQFSSGIYTVDQLNQMQQQTGERWGFAPTQFNEGINFESGISKAELDRLIPKSDSEILALAQQWGHDITDKNTKANIISNYNSHGILPSNDRIKAVEYQAGSNIIAIDAINEILEMASHATVGVGSYTSEVRGTPAFNLKNLLETVQATAAFDSLQSMRAASKTGGALGQVSEKELKLLIAAKGAMDQGQSLSMFKKNLNKIRNILITVNKAAYEDLGMEVPQDFRDISQVDDVDSFLDTI